MLGFREEGSGGHYVYLYCKSVWFETCGNLRTWFIKKLVGKCTVYSKLKVLDWSASWCENSCQTWSPRGGP